MSAVAVPFEARVRRHAAAQPTLWEFVAASGLQSLVCASSKDPNAKVTVLLVSPESGDAVFAVKAPTTPAAEGAVDIEARILQELARRRLGPLTETIPRLVEVVEFEQRRAAVMSALPGRPLSTASQTRRRIRDAAAVTADFHAAGEWLAQLQRATAVEAAPVDLDSGVVTRLGERFARDSAFDSDLEHLERLHARLRQSSVPRTFVHGDFWAGNILVSDGRITGVVDWEAAMISGEPVRDLVRFANMFALYLDRRVRRGRTVPGHSGLYAGEWGAGIEYALYGEGWFPSLYQGFLQDGLARLGADPARWRDAALAGVIEVAALTDHQDFARFHLELFRRLTSRQAVL
jgi:aminoglycoside phosphotransferase (APT) family kinase protein